MRLTTTPLIALLLLAATPAGADSEEFGNHIVHYSVLPSVMISAPVALEYGITRSRYRGLINVSIQEKQPGGLPRPVKAEVSGQAKNIHGQIQPLELREIREGEAIYYIGGFSISNDERLEFKVRVVTAGGREHNLSFDNVFYVE